MDFSYIDKMKDEQAWLNTFMSNLSEKIENLDKFLSKEVGEHDKEDGKPTTSPIQMAYMGMQFDSMNTAITALSAYRNILDVRVHLDETLKEVIEKQEEKEEKKEPAEEEKEDSKKK